MNGPYFCSLCGFWPARETGLGLRCHICETREWADTHPVPLPNGVAALRDLAVVGVPGAGAEARPYLASDMRPRDGGPRFRVTRGGECVEDEDFIFDAMLRIGGDFGDGQRTAYAQWIADALNKADEKLPREPRGA